MRVLCVGGESTGTRLLARIVEQMGAEPVHRSAPYAGEWPDLAALKFDRALVAVRDWRCAAASQVAHHPPETPGDAYENLRRAYAQIVPQLQAIGAPWWMVTYESLVADPAWVTATIAGWLGLDGAKAGESIVDGNAKWKEVA